MIHQGGFVISKQLLGGDWNMNGKNDFPEALGNNGDYSGLMDVNGCQWIFFHSVGNFIIPTDFHSIIFQRGRHTTNQMPLKFPLDPIKPPLKIPFNHQQKCHLSQQKSCQPLLQTSMSQCF
jgi:hypothetical protein